MGPFNWSRWETYWLQFLSRFPFGRTKLNDFRPVPRIASPFDARDHRSKGAERLLIANANFIWFVVSQICRPETCCKGCACLSYMCPSIWRIEAHRLLICWRFELESHETDIPVSCCKSRICLLCTGLSMWTRGYAHRLRISCRFDLKWHESDGTETCTMGCDCLYVRDHWSPLIWSWGDANWIQICCRFYL